MPRTDCGPGETASISEDRLERVLSDRIDWRFRSFPLTGEALTVRDVGSQGWSLFAGDLLFPVLVLKEEALAHNIELLARFCRQHDVSLAPHAKTPMAPQVVARQLAAGAWGVSVANASQARVFRAFGVDRLLLANEVLDKASLGWIASELRDPTFDFYCLVDSVRQVRWMSRQLDEMGAPRPVQVLLEIGCAGGRAGCRTIDELESVAATVVNANHLELAGVEAFEGVVGHGEPASSLVPVDHFLDQFIESTRKLVAAGVFGGRREVIVSAGGSAFLDRVVARVPKDLARPTATRIVLRSGAYVTHDSGYYVPLTPFGTRVSGPPLQAAFEAWGVILSRPEPELAIAGFGKRDVPYDLGLPTPHLVKRPDSMEEVEPGRLTIQALNDHHAIIRVLQPFELNEGDLVGCGISHPCTAFEKWSLIPVVDDDYVVKDAIRTYF